MDLAHISVIASTAFLLILPARAAECDPQTLERANGEFPYGDQGDYCSGFYREQVAGGLNVLSATLGLIPEAKSDGHVVVMSPSATQAAVGFVAMPTSPTIRFRLTGRLEPNTAMSLRWNAIQSQTGLLPRQFGFLAYSASDRSQVVPLCVGRSRQACLAENVVLVVIRPAVDVSRLDARIHYKVAGRWGNERVFQLAPNGSAGGRAISFRVPVLANADETRVDFSASVNLDDGRNLATTISFGKIN